MADTTLVNYFDCDQQRKGTGTPSCDVPTGVPTGFFLVEKNWRLDPAVDEFNTEYIKDKIKEGVFIPFLDAINFTDNSEEAVIYTTQLGVKLLARDGKPEFTFDYSKGYCYHAAAWSYNSFGNYDVILTYDNGVVFLAKTPDEKLKAHTAGLVNTAGFSHKDGSESEKTAITVQLLNAREYNTNGALMGPAANGFDLDGVNGIIDCSIVIESVDFTTDSIALVKITASCNTAVDILGVTTDNLRWLGNTAAATVDDVSYDSTTGLYSVTATGVDISGDFPDTLELQIHDSTADVSVAEIPDGSGALYQGRGGA